MLRVVIVSHAYIEEEIRKGIAALAHEVQVTVVTPDVADVLVFADRQVRSSDKHLELFNPVRTIRLFRSQYVFLSFDLGFRRSRPDVVCVEYQPWSLMFWQTLLCCRMFARNSRFVCSVKKNTYRRNGMVGGLKTLIAKIGVTYVDRFIAASRMTADLYRDLFRIDGEMIDVMTHLGVDTEHFSPPANPRKIDPDGAVVGYVGRLDGHKGIEDLVLAVEHCRSSSGLDIRLSLCGRGSLLPRLEELAASRTWLSVSGAIPNSEVAGFLQGLDIFVLPSRILPDHQEHDAHALLEALACGLPCIATRSGINAELLEDGTGVLVEPQRPVELAEAIGSLAGDTARRRDLSWRGRQRAVAEFDNHRLAHRKAELFKEVAM